MPRSLLVQRVSKTRLSPEVHGSISGGSSFSPRIRTRWELGQQNHPVADTSVALMAFMSGHVPSRGKYGRNMDRAIAYLINVGKKGNQGYIYAS